MRSIFAYEEIQPHEMLSGPLYYVISVFDAIYTSKPKRYIFIGFLIAMVVFLTPTQRSAVTHTPRSVTPSGKCYDKAAVAADSDTCSDIGRDILQRGGSAVDAAIAALLCVSVINPQSMGIGGGVVFTIYSNSSGKVETINARETAPMSATADMFVNDTQKTKPGLLIAVPGELRGYQQAHDRHGRLPWKELFQPSIKLARKGFQIGKALARAINETGEKILNSSALCDVFCDVDYKLLKENDIIRFPKLAATYRKIAEEGPDAFYNGSLTQYIVDDIRAAGGNITREDLIKYYKANLTEPALNFTVGKYTFYAPTAPFGGPVLTLIMKTLLGNGTEGFLGFDFSSKSVSTKESKALTYHRIIEAFRFADVWKSKLGDPVHDENITKTVQTMTLDVSADEIRSWIKDNIKQNSYGGKEDLNVDFDHGTSHVSVIDADGNAVAVTSSINDYFGSAVMSECTGIIFNNQMSDYTYMKSEINKIKPGKRPLSSMCPTIILDKTDSKKVRMVVGGAGGTNITTSVAQVILNYLYFDYDLLWAVAEPRVQITQNWTHVEEGFDKCVVAGLEKRNHTIVYDTELSMVQVVARQGDKICAVSDLRNGGYQMLSTASVFLLLLSTIFSREIAVQ